MRVILLLRARVSVSLSRLSSLNPIADPRAVPELSALPRDSMVCITRRNLADSLTSLEASFTISKLVRRSLICYKNVLVHQTAGGGPEGSKLPKVLNLETACNNQDQTLPVKQKEF
jgi:hypothetical protein